MTRTQQRSSNPDTSSGGGSANARATGLTIGLVLLSRVLGVIRDIVIAHTFGQNYDTTIFRNAFRVPDLIALVIAGGALSSVFIPVFTKYWDEKKEGDAWRTFGSVLTIVAVAVTLLIIGMEAAVVPLTHLLNPKFKTVEAVTQTAALTQILLPVQWCLMVGGLMMGTLYARKRFLVPGLSALFYNLGQIVGALVFGHTLGLSAMAWGALVGAFIGNVVLPFYEMCRIGVRWRLGFDFGHPGVRQVGRLMVPVLLGQSLSQLNMWITGGLLGEDWRYSALTNAYNLTQAPIGIFAQAFGIVLLPTISELAGRGQWKDFRKTVRLGVQRVLFLTIPASVLMSILAEPIIRVIYRSGKFTDVDVHRVAAALLCYSLATFAWSALSILARGFNALQDTKTPVFITTPMVVVFFLLAWIYTWIYPNGYAGIALSASFCGIVTFVLFLYFLRARAGGLNLKAIGFSIARIAFAALVSGVVALVLREGLGLFLGISRLASLLTLTIAGGVALAVYGGIAYFLKYPELSGTLEMFRRRTAPDAAVPPP